MILRRIQGQNFLSFKEFDVTVADLGLTLVEGSNEDDPTLQSNGAGKSAFLEAIRWGLYGEVAKPGVSADDVINDQVGKGCEVQLTFEDEQTKKVYCISRFRKVAGKNGFRIQVDGEEAPEQTQEVIDSIIGRSESIFRHSIFAGQKDMKSFMMLTDSERKKVLDEILGMENMSRARDLASRRLRDNDAKLQTFKSNYIYAEDLLSRQRATYNSQAEQAERDYKQKKQTLQEQLSELQKESSLIALSTLKAHRDSLTVELVACSKRKKEAERAVELARQAEMSVRVEKQGWLATLKGLTERRARYLSQSTGNICTTCGNEVTKASVKNLISAVEKEMATAEGNISRAGNDLEYMKQTTADTEKVLKDVPDSSEINNRLIAVTGTIRRKEDLDATIKRLTAELTALKPFDLGMLAKDIEKTEKDIVQLGADIAVLEDKSKLLLFWVEGFGQHGIRSLVLDSVCGSLSEFSNKVASTLTDGSLAVSWSASDDKKDALTVQTQSAFGSDKYGLQSGAESSRVDFCVRVALQELAESRAGKGLNIRIYDEAFHTMDKSLVERVLMLLQVQASEVGTVFVITHDDSMREHPAFKTRIKVTKQGGFSSVVVDNA